MQKKIDSAKKSSTNYASLMVSLYLVLLTFFIVIHSMSRTHYQRTSDVMQSVYNSFGPKGIIPKEEFVLPVPGKNEYQRQSDQYSLDYVMLIFQESFGLSSDAVEQHGNHLQVKLPLHFFFAGENTSIRTIQRRFLDRLSMTLKNAEQHAPIEVQIMIGGRRLEDITLDEKTLFEMHQMNAIIDYLLNNAIDPERIQAGFQETDPNHVIFEFETIPLGLSQGEAVNG